MSTRGADFGKWFGDWETVAGISRDRVPFILTMAMVYVINRGSDEYTEYFQVCTTHNCVSHIRARMVCSVLSISVARLSTAFDIVMCCL
jgi:hypothetical protein